MDKKKSTSARLSMPIIVNVCRFILGAAFVFSGVVKAVDPVGTQVKLTDYLSAFGLDGSFSDGTLLIAACALAGLEFLMGIYMFLGAFGRGTSLVLLIVMSFFTPFTLYLAVKNPVHDCGCFGDAMTLSNWQTFGKNVFLLFLAVFVFVFRRFIVPVVTIGRQWLVSVVSVTVIVMFMAGNIRNLPIIDLRAYKVGTNLHDNVMLQLDPKVSDFSLFDKDMNDYTDEILSDKGYTFLLILSHLETASEGHLDLIDDVYDYCKIHGYKMYGVTASSRGEVLNWIDNTGAEYGFLYSDEIPLKTMVRSNPGLVLIRDGVIMAKWSEANMPDEAFLSAPLEELGFDVVPVTDNVKDALCVVVFFLIPLLLVILIDRLKCLIHNS